MLWTAFILILHADQARRALSTHFILVLYGILLLSMSFESVEFDYNFLVISFCLVSYNFILLNKMKSLLFSVYDPLIPIFDYSVWE